MLQCFWECVLMSHISHNARWNSKEQILKFRHSIVLLIFANRAIYLISCSSFAKIIFFCWFIHEKVFFKEIILVFIPLFKNCAWDAPSVLLELKKAITKLILGNPRTTLKKNQVFSNSLLIYWKKIYFEYNLNFFLWLPKI